MSDIHLPTSVVNVQWQEEKPHQDGEPRPRDPAAEKAAESYEESQRTITDKITILGIPIDLMTTQVQATIAGLVSEVDHLKTRLNRFEKGQKSGGGLTDQDVLVGDAFNHALDKALSAPPPPGHIRELALVVVNTYEDIRTSSGLLSANSALTEVATRLGNAGLGSSIVGLIGGPTVAALLTRPNIHEQPGVDDAGHEHASTADIVREAVEAEAYPVAGLDMDLRFTVASMRVETGQSAVHAIGQADHILRS
jgi:GGDEF domain-containing protein